MKKIILAASVLFCTTLFAQDNGGNNNWKQRNDESKQYQQNDRRYHDDDDDYDDYDDNDRRYNSNKHWKKEKFYRNVPTQVRRNFEFDFPGARNVEWTKNRGIFTATFTLWRDRFWRSVSYKANGRRI